LRIDSEALGPAALFPAAVMTAALLTATLSAVTLLPACGSSAGVDPDGAVGDSDGGAPSGEPRSLSLGSLGSCVVYSSGQQYCWGWNQNGQFGTRRDTQFERPAYIHELGAVEKMSLSCDFGCVLLSGGDVECMGYDHGGTDQPVALGAAALDLATGDGHGCALLTDGTVECWGQNSEGQLGDGTLQGREGPAPVSGLTGAAAVHAASDRSCALDEDGGVWCWGRRLDGSNDDRLSPEQIPDLGVTVALSMSDGQTCALQDDGTVMCWGYGACDALDQSGDCPTPVSVPGLAGVREIAAGDSAACARTDGSLLCWGENFDGQMGNGTLDPVYTPTAVEGLADVALVGFGDDHVCVALSSGDIYCWGSNGNGQIGNGTTLAQLTPTNVGL
jgi:alpha-tubulin suppressor-like RCC1 family protein